MLLKKSAYLLALLLIVSGCGSPPSSDSNEQVSSNSSGTGEGGIPVSTGPAPEVKDFGKAPETFRAQFETSKGDFTIEVTRAWSPAGADRFYNLVKNNFFDGCCFFRVLDGFMAQVGINGNPRIQEQWRERNIVDDPVVESNRRSYVTFAKSGLPNSRSTQIFINYGDNFRLDQMGFSPFGKVIEGMDVVEKLYGGYGEGAPHGSGPDQGRVQEEGNAYLRKFYPKLDFINKATVIGEEPANGNTPSSSEKSEN